MAINSLSSSYSAAQIASLFSALPSPEADTASSKGGATATQPLSPKSIQQSVAASTATLQAIIQSSEANSKAGQSSTSLAASAYSGTAAEAEKSTGTSGTVASASSNWMSQNIDRFETAWKEAEPTWASRWQYMPKDEAAAGQAYETAVSTAIANHTMTYVPASQAPGLDVCENTTTWATGSETYYGYNGDALNAFVKSQGKTGGLVIWGDTPEESTVALW